MVQSTSGDSSGVQITVQAGSPLAEVFLIDHDFVLVHRSIGELRATVDPGVYKVKSRLGDAETERLVLCEQDMDIDMSADLRISTPAPVATPGRAPSAAITLTRRLAVQSAAAPRATPGATAQLLLVSRSRDRATAPPEVSVYDAAGNPVPFPADLGSTAARGAVTAVDPGVCYLRWRSGSGVEVEQAVHAVAGWQTQLFVLRERGDPSDLGTIRISIVCSRAGFDAESAELRRSEELRTALADERKVAAHALDDLIERSESPTLDLFGAHLMLLARDEVRRHSSRDRPQAPVHFDEARFEHLVDSLRDRLGAGHPDVVALATQVPSTRLEALEPVSGPPLLWRSWELLVEASNDVPWLVEADVWRRTAATVPLRPFLMWLTGAGEAASSIEKVLHRAWASAEQPDDELRRSLMSRLMVPRSVVDAITSP